MDITPEGISIKAEKTLKKLSPELQFWVRNHLVKPYPVRLTPHPDGGDEEDFWIVTDHTGEKDSSQRVVFNPRTKSFGVEMTLENGRNWYLGDSGPFNKAVMDM